MKNNKLMKLLLSFFMVLTITCTKTETILNTTSIHYDSQIEFLDDKLEASPFDDIKNQ